MSSHCFLDNANVCAALAERASSDADRQRYERMVDSWLKLARLNDWLEDESIQAQSKNSRSDPV